MRDKERGYKMRKILVVLMIAAAFMLTAACASEEDMLFEKVCTADEALELAKKTDTVVFEDINCTSGKKTWEDFCDAVSEGSKASVLVAEYYTLDQDRVSERLYEEEKDNYPKLFFSKVTFDGHSYRVRSRDCSLSELDSDEIYSCMLHFTTDAYDIYVLADDPDLTWEGIRRSEYSSYSNDYVRHCVIYSEYFMAEEADELHAFCGRFSFALDIGPLFDYCSRYTVADVNEDGHDDLCTSLTYGSGIVRTSVIVYDAYNKEFYKTDDLYDYHCIVGVDDDGRLIVNEDRERNGTVVIEDGVLVFVPYD